MKSFESVSLTKNESDAIKMLKNEFSIAKVILFGEKDRGKDVASAPWFHVFKGDRINGHHLSLEEKRAARKRKEKEGQK